MESPLFTPKARVIPNVLSSYVPAMQMYMSWQPLDRSYQKSFWRYLLMGASLHMPLCNRNTAEQSLSSGQSWRENRWRDLPLCRWTGEWTPVIAEAYGPGRRRYDKLANAGESPMPYVKMSYKNMGSIGWSQPAAEIEHMLWGLDPWPGAYTFWNGNMLKMWKAAVEKKDATKRVPGTVLKAKKDYFSVQNGDGVLKIPRKSVIIKINDGVQNILMY